MILWSRDLEYKKKLTIAERELIAKKVAPPKTLDKCKTINILINAIICAIVFHISHCGFIALAVAFVLTDAILLSLDQLIFVSIPYRKTMRMKLSKAQDRLAEVIEKRDKLNDDICEFARQKCGEWRCDGKYCPGCKCAAMKTERDMLSRFIRTEQEYIEKEIEKVKEVEIKEDKRQSKDYTDKKDYFAAIREKLEFLVNKQNMTFLRPVLNSVIKLIDTLERKPFGYDMISASLYVYLDELHNITTKLVGLDESQRERYMKDVFKISEALSNNIDNLNRRISVVENQDIEVSIDVLLKELTESGGD